MTDVIHLRLGVTGDGCHVAECGHFAPAARCTGDPRIVTCGGCRRTRAYKRFAGALRPILAVDVDGVLNACGNGPPPPGWADSRALRYRIRHNPGHGRLLLNLARQTGAELIWCTTWEELANQHIAPMVGLPSLPWVPMEPGRAEVASASPGGGMRAGTYHHSVGETKAAAMAIYAGDRPFCWLDDEPDAADELKSHPVPHLVVHVDERYGLQDEHFEAARAWLAEVARA